jgi:multidrug efflux pump subunit AcrB
LLVTAAFAASALLAVYRIVPSSCCPSTTRTSCNWSSTCRAARRWSTDAVARELGAYLARINEVTDYETYVGSASPMDFNGMVRHYYLRREPHQADIRINLLPKELREHQSHQIALRIRPGHRAHRQGARRQRQDRRKPARPAGALHLRGRSLWPPDADVAALATVTEQVRAEVSGIKGIVDVDDYVDEPPTGYALPAGPAESRTAWGDRSRRQPNPERAALSGQSAGIVHAPGERQPLEILIRLPRMQRSSIVDLATLRVRGANGVLIPLSEIGVASEEAADLTIYHKNLKRLNYVIAEMVGREPVEAVMDWGDLRDRNPLPKGYTVDLAGEGEWKITVDVFRDLGLAFGAALLMIYRAAGRPDRLPGDATHHHGRHTADRHRHHARFLVPQ